MANNILRCQHQPHCDFTRKNRYARIYSSWFSVFISKNLYLHHLLLLSYILSFFRREFKCMQGIRNYVDGVKPHLYNGADCPYTWGFELNTTYFGLIRIIQQCVKHVLPITPNVLVEITTPIYFCCSPDITIWVSYLRAFSSFPLCHPEHSLLMAKSHSQGRPKAHFFRLDHAS